jgi:acetoin:2,6-dichlorophenolindophenol oxidoreductase subunit alpha
MISDSELFRQLYRIRFFEETVLENFPKGIFNGTTHVYIGQEANAVGVLSQRNPEDIVFSNHRCHGHFLAYGGDSHALFAELMGKNTGLCGGRGGSQHLHWKNFYSNGVQGGIVPIATGMALAEKFLRQKVITIVFLGDGTMGEGVVYETLNLASLWKIPILFVVENNHIAQTTPANLTIAGNIRHRFEAFGISVNELDTSDVVEILALARKTMSEVRLDQTPQAIILNTCRFAPHSKGDDTRSTDELFRMRIERDPIMIHAKRLEPIERRNIEDGVEKEILNAFQQALQDPFPVSEMRGHPSEQ